MRSYRYKRHRAHDGITAHCIGKEHYWGGWYPIRSPEMRNEYYKVKHYHWWTTVHRWDWRFINSYDKENFVFSNMEYTKWRICKPYEMLNLNHDY